MSKRRRKKREPEAERGPEPEPQPESEPQPEKRFDLKRLQAKVTAVLRGQFQEFLSGQNSSTGLRESLKNVGQLIDSMEGNLVDYYEGKGLLLEEYFFALLLKNMRARTKTLVVELVNQLLPTSGPL